MRDETRFVPSAPFSLRRGHQRADKSRRRSGAEASAGILERVGQARRARVGKDHDRRRRLCDRGRRLPSTAGPTSRSSTCDCWSGRFKQSSITPLGTTVPFLRPAMAVAHGSSKIGGEGNIEGTLRQPRYGGMTVVREKRKGSWLGGRRAEHECGPGHTARTPGPQDADPDSGSRQAALRIVWGRSITGTGHGQGWLRRRVRRPGSWRPRAAERDACAWFPPFRGRLGS